MARPLLEVEGVWKRLCRRPDRGLRYALADIGREVVGLPPGRRLREGEFWALQDVSLSVEAGRVFGVIGHNGAGKSTLINLVTGILQPTDGTITLQTDKVAVIDHGGGMNVVETGRENALTQLVLHGMPEERLAEEIAAVGEFADLGNFFDAPVATYSRGMRQRLVFSIYTRLDPDLFIVDEAIGGGDLRFRNRFRGYLRSFVDDGGAMLLCSHDLHLIDSFCSECVLIDAGRMVLSGQPTAVIDRYHALAEDRETSSAVRRTRPRRGIGSESRQPLDSRCAIESVVARGPDDGPTRPGEAAVIEVTIRVHEPIDGVACGIEIGRGDHRSLGTLIGGTGGDPFRLLPPRTVIRCRIDSLPLAPGTYDLRAGLSLPHSGQAIAVADLGDSAAKLQVVADVGPAANLARQRLNVVHMAAAWEISAEPQLP